MTNRINNKTKADELRIFGQDEHHLLIPHKGNRTHSKSHLEKLRASLSSIGQLEPIIVRPHPVYSGFEIIGGHGRFGQLKSLNMPVSAIIKYNLADKTVPEIIRYMINGTKSKDWKAKHALEAWAEYDENYQWVQEVVDTYGLPISCLYKNFLFPPGTLSGDTTTQKDAFILGQFELTDSIRHKTNCFGTLVRSTRSLKKRSWTIRTFGATAVNALYTVSRKEGFDRSRWFKALKLHNMDNHSSHGDYVDHFLDDIYNYKLTQKNRI